MFTLDDIGAAHAKVRSGADFPGYVQELKALGLLSYSIYVADGHATYMGADDFSLTSGARYTSLAVAQPGSPDALQQALAAHQGGDTDYSTFCRQAAAAGVNHWTVHMTAMTCTYYGRAGVMLLVEQIPMPH